MFGRSGENNGAVLRAHVVALAVQGGGVVGAKKDGQQVLVGNFCGVEGDFNGFGVTRAAAANSFVAWVRGGATGVTGPDFHYALECLVNGLGAPEASSSKNSDFGFHAHIIT